MASLPSACRSGDLRAARAAVDVLPELDHLQDVAAVHFLAEQPADLEAAADEPGTRSPILPSCAPSGCIGGASGVHWGALEAALAGILPELDRPTALWPELPGCRRRSARAARPGMEPSPASPASTVARRRAGRRAALGASSRRSSSRRPSSPPAPAGGRRRLRCRTPIRTPLGLPSSLRVPPRTPWIPLRWTPSSTGPISPLSMPPWSPSLPEPAPFNAAPCGPHSPSHPPVLAPACYEIINPPIWRPPAGCR